MCNIEYIHILIFFSAKQLIIDALREENDNLKLNINSSHEELLIANQYRQKVRTIKKLKFFVSLFFVLIGYVL